MMCPSAVAVLMCRGNESKKGVIQWNDEQKDDCERWGDESTFKPETEYRITSRKERVSLFYLLFVMMVSMFFLGRLRCWRIILGFPGLFSLLARLGCCFTKKVIRNKRIRNGW